MQIASIVLAYLLAGDCSIQGSWKVISLEASGQAVPAKDFKNVKWTLVVRKNRFVYTTGAVRFEGNIELDQTKEPKSFKATATNDMGARFEIAGIYGRVGDSLRVCLTLKENDTPPREFKTSPDSQAILLEFARRKP
jgi:uncharacterized protein (TIGR03067 family)